MAAVRLQRGRVASAGSRGKEQGRRDLLKKEGTVGLGQRRRRGCCVRRGEEEGASTVSWEREMHEERSRKRRWGCGLLLLRLEGGRRDVDLVDEGRNMGMEVAAVLWQSGGVAGIAGVAVKGGGLLGKGERGGGGLRERKTALLMTTRKRRRQEWERRGVRMWG